MSAPANPHPNAQDKPLLPEPDFIAGFHAIGDERYHHKHPFHLLMHEGKLTRGQLQAWALNRYYYQSRIPIKDAAILARTEDPAFRLAWRKRILDHDGDGTKPGGIEKWLRLVEATGLSRDQAIRGGVSRQPRRRLAGLTPVRCRAGGLSGGIAVQAEPARGVSIDGPRAERSRPTGGGSNRLP